MVPSLVAFLALGASGELTTIDMGKAATEAGLDGDPSPQGFTLDPSGQWAFVSTKSLNRVAVVNLVDGTPLSTSHRDVAA